MLETIFTEPPASGIVSGTTATFVRPRCGSSPMRSAVAGEKAFVLLLIY
jgi:hypothetical protein